MESPLGAPGLVGIGDWGPGGFWGDMKRGARANPRGFTPFKAGAGARGGPGAGPGGRGPGARERRMGARFPPPRAPF